MKVLGPRNWSLQAKMAALLIVASSIPLAIVAYLDVRQTRAELTVGMERLLAARAEQIARELDSTHAGYLGAVRRLARVPVTEEYCAGDAAQRARLQARLQGTFAAFPAVDPSIRGVGMIDSTGRVVASLRPTAVGLDVSRRDSVQKALAGAIAISGIYISDAATGSEPTVGYLIPVGGGKPGVHCALGAWVHADAYVGFLKASNGLAGPGSYATIFDENGIQIANSRDNTLLYRPGGTLDPAVVDQLSAERRFGAQTRELLQDVKPAPERFARSRAALPEPAMFHSPAVGSQQWNYGVARRLKSLPWTVFYLVPEQSLTAQIAAATREKALIALAFIGGAALLGLWFASTIVRPVRALASATDRIAAGDTTVRLDGLADDELGRLATSFNAMADRIEAHARALQSSNEQLETHVRERTALLHTVMENSAAAISLKDLEGRYLLVNERLAKVFGRRKPEVLGRTIMDILDADSATRIHQFDMRVLADGNQRMEEVTVPEDDGPHTYLMVKCPVQNQAGRTHALVTIGTDITERKNAETRLLDQLERLKLLDRITSAIGEKQGLHSIYGAVTGSLEDKLPVDFCCICDYEPHGSVLTVLRVGPRSESIARDLALTEGAHFAIDPRGCLAPCLRGQLTYEPDISASMLAQRSRLAQGDLASVVVVPLMAESGIFGVLVAGRRQAHAFNPAECEFLRQLSGHVALAARQAQLNDALRTAYEDLRQSQQKALQQERLSALGQMASGIAHDINNAISPVAIYTETLLEREPNLSPHARDCLLVIARAIDDVASTVARMREFYRPQEPQLALEPLDLNELVRQVIDLTHARWSDMAQQRGACIEVVRQLAPGLPAIMGVGNEIREALINLVFNAVDAMPEGGQLTLRTQRAANDQRVELDVLDTGVGMDEATRRRCLEPFFTTKGERGTGLGLAMVYGIAQRHGARVDIESALGVGTLVRLSFPVSAGSAALDRSTPSAAPALRRLRLLIVDDDLVLLRSLRDMLEGDGHLVTAANGGHAGMEAFQAVMAGPDAFDAVITDLGMANVDGRQLAVAIKQASPPTPVIMLTGWGGQMAEDGEVPPCVDKLLGKPPKLRDLRMALAEAVCAAGTL